MWDGLDKNPFLCPQGDSQMTKKGLEPLNSQCCSLGRNGTRALKNQERTCWSLSPDSKSIHCRQLWWCPQDRWGHNKSLRLAAAQRERHVAWAAPKIYPRQNSPESQAPTACLALAGVCRKEQGRVEEGIDMTSALYKLVITADTKPQRKT